MGEQVDRNNDELIKEVGGRTNGGNTKGASTTDTTTTTSGGSGGNRSRGSGGKTTTEKEVVSSVVDVEEQKRLERNAKRRERYAKQKAEGTLKPKKVNTKKKAKDETLGSEQIENLLKTVSMMIATRPNQEHWLLSDSEVKSISEPLAKILQDSQAFATLGEHSNAVALSIACITIILPRAIKSIMDINEKKKKVKEVKNNAKLHRNKTKNITDDRRNDTNASASGANNSNNEHWFGQAISY